MVTWELLNGPEAEELWDKELVKFPNFTVFQTFAWGEYKRGLGWTPCRWAAYDQNRGVRAMMQGLLRRYPLSTGLVWVPGGPVGDIADCNEGLHQALVQTTGLKRLYCRIFSNQEHRTDEAAILQSHKWSMAGSPINSGSSMRYEAAKEDAQMLKESSKNWRHNLRRSEKYNLTIRQWTDPDINEMLSLYTSMQEYKNLGQQFSEQELKGMFEKLGDRIVLYSCKDGNGELIGFRGCAVIADRGWELFAATSVKGRKMYASYALFRALIQKCRSMGVRSYDMGGVDPVQNQGTYNFKKGTGALPVKYLGEWDWATSGWLRLAANWAISRRGGRL